jgi:hypothetical protein
MGMIEIFNQQDKYFISIDKSSIDKNTLYRLIENLRIEYLARKINFDESIEKFGEKIKKQWWKKNKKIFLKSSK